MSGKYPSDLTDEQLQILRGRLPRPAKRGRRPICRRLILNAILYVNRTGCQWRALPHDFPKWKTVYTIFWRWRRDGLWQRINEALCRQIRKHSGKKPTPSVAIVDSQSIRTAEGGEERGYDACKKITMEPALCFKSSAFLAAYEFCLPTAPTVATVCRSGSRKPSVGSSRRCCGLWERMDSSCCRSDGLWNAPLPGSLAIADTVKTTSEILSRAKP